jgi:magnesium chelatase family protein
MIHSLSGLLDEGGINRECPFREPHHTASMAAIVGGGCDNQQKQQLSS